MRNFFFNTAAAALIGLTGLSFTPAGAQAQDIQLELGKDGPKVRVLDNCDPDVEYCGERRDSRRDSRRERRERHEERGCSEDRALDKAERMGVRRARVEGVGRRTIEVRGRTRNGERVRLTFGRAPNCPVLN